MKEVLLQVLTRLRSASRYRWAAMGMAWVVGIAGAVFALKIPDRYEATAQVLVDTTSMLKPLMSGMTVTPNLDQQISMVGRTLTSRPKVEKVARMTDLDITATTPEDKEALYDTIANRLKVRSAGRENLYTISYVHDKPEVAKKIVQSFLNIFVETSLSDKRQDSETARRFIEDQIKQYEQRLQAAEAALVEFKRKNSGLMPGDGKDYSSRLATTQQTLLQSRLELREAENSRDAIRRQMTGETPTISTTNPLTGMIQPVPAAPNPAEQRLAALRTQLDTLRLKYTDEHPDVVRTQTLIKELEEQRRRELAAIAKGGLKLDSELSSTMLSPNPVYQQLKIAYAQAESSIATLRTRVSEYEARVAELKRSADKIPQVEAEFVQLTRDYDVNKKNYEGLIQRRESAQISGDLERTPGVVDFRVIDPPRVPLLPSFPNRPAFLLAALIAALASGVLTAVALSELHPTVGDRKALRDLTQLPVIGAVTQVWTEASRRQRRLRMAGFASLAALLIATFGAIIVYVVLKSHAAL